MPKPVPLPPPGFDDLSVDEKIDHLQSLWHRIQRLPRRFRFPIGIAKSFTSASKISKAIPVPATLGRCSGTAPQEVRQQH